MTGRVDELREAVERALLEIWFDGLSVPKVTTAVLAALEPLVVPRDEHERKLHDVDEMLEASNERAKWPVCACDYDAVGDVCGVHSSAVARERANADVLRVVVRRLLDGWKPLMRQQQWVRESQFSDAAGQYVVPVEPMEPGVADALAELAGGE